MRYAILLGRGIEGCGVTRFAIEMANHIKPYKFYYTSDKKWTRSNFQSFEGVGYRAAETDSVISDLNENTDYLLIPSVPSTKHSDQCQTEFIRLLQEYRGKKVFFHLDHSVKALSVNARLKDVCANVDIIFAHSNDGVLARWLKKNNIKSEVLNLPGNPFDFDGHRSQYWKPIEEQNSKLIRFIGRTARWKGPQLLCDFHEDYMRKHEYTTILEGLEAGVSWWIVAYKDYDKMQQPRNINNFYRPTNPEDRKKKVVHGSEIPGEAAYCYPSYVRNECMERLSKSAYGVNLYHLKENLYGSSIEYAHCEIVSSGCVPIFHKHFGQNVIHKKYQKPLYDCENNGTVWYDPDNLSEVEQTLLKLSSDNVLRNEWREKAFLFYKEQCHSQKVMSDLFTEIKNHKSNLTLESFFE